MIRRFLARFALVAIAGTLTFSARSSVLRAQEALDQPTMDSLRTMIDRALVTSRMRDFDDALSFTERTLTRRPDDAVLLHYRGFVLFRKASVLATTKRDDREAKALFEEAGRALARSQATLPWPETPALQSAVTGQLIGLGGALKAMRLGSKASHFLDDALARGPDNPRVWMIRGTSELFRPRLFGGSAEKAETSLKHAIALFGTDAPTGPAPWWGHAEAYGWLGQAYARQRRFDEARAAYAKALELQPGNTWVAELLLPALGPQKR